VVIHQQMTEVTQKMSWFDRVVGLDYVMC